MLFTRKVGALVAMTVLIALVSGCRGSSSVNALGTTPAADFTPAPTSTSLFDVPTNRSEPSNIEVFPTQDASANNDTTFRPMFGQTPTPVAQPQMPTATSTPVPTAIPAITANDYREIIVYGDKINANWSLEHSRDMAYDPYDTVHWFSRLDELQDSGATSIAVTPLEDYGRLFFTVRPDSKSVYEREQVLGVSFWLNSGASILDTDDLVLTVVGSNDLSYWSPEDYSAFSNPDNTFSETRLYYLGLNRAIPPGTWVQIVLWLDDLQYDPEYSNVVGLYIKNDAGFLSTFYIDNVSLLVIP